MFSVPANGSPTRVPPARSGSSQKLSSQRTLSRSVSARFATYTPVRQTSTHSHRGRERPQAGLASHTSPRRRVSSTSADGRMAVAPSSPRASFLYRLGPRRKEAASETEAQLKRKLSAPPPPPVERQASAPALPTWITPRCSIGQVDEPKVVRQVSAPLVPVTSWSPPVQGIQSEAPKVVRQSSAPPQNGNSFTVLSGSWVASPPTALSSRQSPQGSWVASPLKPAPLFSTSECDHTRAPSPQSQSTTLAPPSTKAVFPSPSSSVASQWPLPAQESLLLASTGWKAQANVSVNESSAGTQLHAQSNAGPLLANSTKPQRMDALCARSPSRSPVGSWVAPPQAKAVPVQTPVRNPLAAKFVEPTSGSLQVPGSLWVSQSLKSGSLVSPKATSIPRSPSNGTPKIRQLITPISSKTAASSHIWSPSTPGSAVLAYGATDWTPKELANENVGYANQKPMISPTGQDLCLTPLVMRHEPSLQSALTTRIGFDYSGSVNLQGAIPLVSLGCACEPKLSFRRLGYQMDTLPFDWIRTRLEGLLHFMRTDFKSFFEFASTLTLPQTPSITIYRSYYHSFWWDDPTTADAQEKYRRRIARFSMIDARSRSVLFVRAVATTDEILRIDELLQELITRFGDRAMLLVIIDRQRYDPGPLLVSKHPNLLIYRMQVDAQDPKKAKAPYTLPVTIGIDWAKGRPVKALVVPDLVAALSSVEPTNLSAEMCGGIEPFEESPPSTATSPAIDSARNTRRGSGSPRLFNSPRSDARRPPRSPSRPPRSPSVQWRRVSPFKS